jgi:hypothetical protein
MHCMQLAAAQNGQNSMQLQQYNCKTMLPLELHHVSAELHPPSRITLVLSRFVPDLSISCAQANPTAHHSLTCQKAEPQLPALQEEPG